VFVTAVDLNGKNAAATENGRRAPPEHPVPRRVTRGFNLQFARISEPILAAWRGAAVEKIAVAGYVFTPDLEAKEDLNVRVRLYRPIDGDLDLAHEQIAKVDDGWPGEPGTYKFTCDLKSKTPVKPGKYLVRVDCLNRRDSQPWVWTSAAEFLTIEAPSD
jgi:hypothetical protein